MGPDTRHARRRRLRAVLFDAGNTLLRINYTAVAAELERHGHPITPEQVEEAELHARILLDRDLAVGLSTESVSILERYVRHLLAHLRITDENEIGALSDWWRGYNPPVGLWHLAHPEAAAALERVKAAGLIAGVVSNSNGSVRSILETTGLARQLDFVIDSAVVGVEKPDPRIFQIGLAEAGVGPDEAVHVGDLYTVDVLGARAAGIEAVLLDPLGLWGPRDCPTAPGVRAAVSLALGEAGPSSPAGGSAHSGSVTPE
jgi:putative hydrolase of the HAD superfamily